MLPFHKKSSHFQEIFGDGNLAWINLMPEIQSSNWQYNTVQHMYMHCVHKNFPNGLNSSSTFITQPPTLNFNENQNE